MTGSGPAARGPVVLFDGVCNLCEAWVNWIIRRDPAGLFRFAPLQSGIGRSLLARAGLPAGEATTVVLLEEGRAYVKSSAALRVARRLGWPWRLAVLFLAVPRPLRDAVYDWVARHRYGWFGRKAECLAATEGAKARFLGAAKDP